MSFGPFTKTIDLSHDLYPGMPVWPTNLPFKCEQILLAARDNYTMTLITQMPAHTGTHLDAPSHFIPDGKPVDGFPLEKFQGSGVVVDLSHKKKGEEITSKDLRRYDSEIRKDDVLMLQTGWDKKRGLTKDYLFMWPHLGTEAARYLASKRIKAVGIDGLSIAGWAGSVPGQGPIASSSPADVHTILLSKEILILEEVANLGAVLHGARSARAYFVFAPLNIVGAEGAPCRAMAFV